MSELKMVEILREQPLTEHLHIRASMMRLPLNGTFELTPLCNMDCKMCYIHLSKEEQEKRGRLRTAEEWIKLGQRAKDVGLLYLLITGGEPFMRPDFREIYTELHKMGFIISINSNGTMINESVMEWLNKYPPMRVNMTLYGASNETYAKLCGNPRGFDQAVHALELLREAGINVRINCSVTPYNVQDLEAIMAFVKRENYIISATSYMFPPLRKDETSVGMNDRFTPAEAAYYQATIERLLNGDDKFLERMKDRSYAGLPSDLVDDCKDIPGDGIKCRAGKCCFWVTWDGKIMPCGMLPPADDANVFEMEFEEAWKKTVAKADAVRLPGKCKECPIQDSCRPCAAMVYTESGCFDKVPEYRCQMAVEYEKAIGKICEEIRSERK